MPAYDLLAPGLYHRLGYETDGIIEGCPAGIASRWYHKDLQTRRARAWPQPSYAMSPAGSVATAPGLSRLATTLLVDRLRRFAQPPDDTRGVLPRARQAHH